MRLDPLFQTRHKYLVIVDGEVIGEVYTLPERMSEWKGKEYENLGRRVPAINRTGAREKAQQNEEHPNRRRRYQIR